MPGVSTSRICVSPSTAIPISRARVVCALSLTIATFWPTSALTKVDLPALGAPMTAAKPGAWSLQLREQGLGGRRFGLLLARSLGGGFAQLRDRHADREQRRVMRAGA